MEQLKILLEKRNESNEKLRKIQLETELLQEKDNFCTAQIAKIDENFLEIQSELKIKEEEKNIIIMQQINLHFESINAYGKFHESLIRKSKYEGYDNQIKFINKYIENLHANIHKENCSMCSRLITACKFCN